jgi:hypothetical protein
MRALEITAEEFKQAIQSNPLWAQFLKKPIVVVDYCNCDGMNIKALSEKITFRGRDENGNCASFKGCPLETAEGTFYGHVDFGPIIKNKKTKKNPEGELVLKPCTIKELNINIIHPNKSGDAINLSYTTSLEKIHGKFPGAVNAQGSGILAVSETSKIGYNESGVSLDLRDCKKIEILNGEFAGSVNLTGTKINRMGKINIQKTDVNGKKLYIDGCSIKTIIQKPNIEAKEISGLESTSSKSINRSVTKRKWRTVETPLDKSEEYHNRLKMLEESKKTAEEKDFWLIEKALGGPITKARLQATLMFLKASTLEARESGKGILDGHSYKVAKEMSDGIIDKKTGGIKTIAWIIIDSGSDWQDILRPLEKFSEEHKKYIQLKKEMVYCLQSNTEKEATKPYIDVKTQTLTERGVRVFGNDPVISCAVRASKTFRSNMNSILEHNEEEKTKSMAEAFFEDDALKLAGEVTKSKKRGLGLKISTIALAAVISIGSITWEEAVKKSVSEPIVEYVTEHIEGYSHLKLPENKSLPPSNIAINESHQESNAIKKKIEKASSEKVVVKNTSPEMH